ncbi:MAG: hypothetical protein WCT16_03310 [Candidatus Buchananbacteria bacterium]
MDTILFKETRAQKDSRKIMGKNFFGIKEAVRCLGVHPTREDLANLSKIYYPRDLLEKCKDTHILVATFPLCIADIREATKGKPVFHYNAYFQSGYSEGAGRVRWILVRKTSVVDSRNKKFKEQETLLGHREYIPTLQVMVYTIIGHFLSTNERLFSNELVRVSTTDAYYRMHVGYFRSEGLMINDDDEEKPYYNIGLSSAI